jgi:Zn-finger nucleic acid-binding protein
MFAGMEYCPHCGAKAARLVNENAPSLRCPACKGDMHAVTIGQTAMRECASCGGEWLETSAFTQLCTSREQRGAAIAFAGVTTGAPVARSAGGGVVRYLSCPVCAKIMNRQNFGRRSGVVIDVCKGHGVWLEANELRAALAFIDSGEFEKARLADEQRVLAERAKLQKQFDDSGREFHRLDMVYRPEPKSKDAGALLEEALRSLLT